MFRGLLTHQINLSFTVGRAAALFLILGVVIVGFGYGFTQEGAFDVRNFVHEIYSNLGIELVSIGLTVIVIEGLNRRAAIQERKEELILQMGSPENPFAVEAVRILRQKGWLKDGSLDGADLYKANLQEADLTNANLQEVNLEFANLQGANLRLPVCKGRI
jgi:uncharacterized protein YjbI with pentapeptide repeats